ncbi:MAG: alpha/beta hydrolase family protein, partial [Stellaceae bacterium]
MRKLLAAGIGAAMAVITIAHAAAPETASYKVGLATRAFTPAGPYDWRGGANHKLTATVGYPGAASAEEKPRQVGAPGEPLFEGVRVATGAAIVAPPEKFPLVVLSHGTGGTAETLAWLGTALAARGYIAAAVNHPGNNAIDGYTIPGFTLWWLRARDLGAVIDGMLADPRFGARIDPQRIGAAGFSLGGYTVIELAGGVTSMAQFGAFCASPEADGMCKSPPEFADLLAKSQALAKSDPAYAAALAKDGETYRDPRVRAVFAMAPALGPAFTPQSLAGIAMPMAIAAGAGDEVVPIGSGARALAARIPKAELT